MLTALPSLLALAVLAPVWHLAGRAAQRLQLPAITGIMLAGVASGPQALGLLSSGGMQSLGSIEQLCLSFIALAAGAELHLPELRRLRKQVACLTVGISLTSWVLVYACMRLLVHSLPFVKLLVPSDVAAVCTLAATLAMARSPASAIAVLKETEGKGPYCSLVMAVVVVKDVILFATFAVNVELFKAVGKHEAAGFPIWLLLDPLLCIMLSVLMGGLGGYGLSKLLRMPHSSIISLATAAVNLPSGGNSGPAAGHSHGNPPGPSPRLLRLLRHPSAMRLRPLLPLLVSGVTFGLAELVQIEPLLACVAAGLLAANWRNDQPQGRDAAELLSADLNRLAPLINALFFGLVGASLKLSAVRDNLWAAAVMFGVRLGAVWVGCWLGAQAGGTPQEVAQNLWMGMVTQAGIALGLAQVVAARFPDWGPDFAALLAGMVVMNLLTGPPLFKMAVIAAGESRALSVPALLTELQQGGDGKVKHGGGSGNGSMDSHQHMEAGNMKRSSTGSSTGGGGRGGSTGGGENELRVLPTIPILDTTRHAL